MIKQQSITAYRHGYIGLSQTAPHIVIRLKNGNGDTFYIPQNHDKAGHIFRSPASKYVKSKNINARQCPQHYTHMKNKIYQCQTT